MTIGHLRTKEQIMNTRVIHVGISLATAGDNEEYAIFMRLQSGDIVITSKETGNEFVISLENLIQVAVKEGLDKA